MDSSVSNNVPPPIVVGNNSNSNTTTHPVSVTSPQRFQPRPRLNSYSINLPPVACEPFSPVPNVTQTQETPVVPTEVLVPTKTSMHAVLLHHEEEQHYVFSEYCRSIDDSLSSTPQQCKYGERKCVVHRSGLIEHGQQLSSLSGTTFSPNPKYMKKNTYSILDTRMLNCSNPTCLDSKSGHPKMFHYSCFRHAMSMKENKNMNILEVNSSDNIFFSNMNKGEEMKSVLTSSKDDTKFILPVCSKTCFNKVRSLKKEKIASKSSTGTSTDDSTPANWEADAKDGKQSSAALLVNWLTTEENASSYFGGNDRNGRTSAKRKEVYHQLLSMLIHKENGSIRTPESIRSKIQRIMDQYKEALLQFNTSGMGLDSSSEATFHEHITKNVCKYYFILEPVLKDRPNMTPAWTNHAGTKKNKRGNTTNCSSDESCATSESSTTSNRSESSFCEVVERSSSTTRSGRDKNTTTQERTTSYASNENQYSTNHMEKVSMKTNDNDCSNVSSLSNDNRSTSNNSNRHKRKSKKKMRKSKDSSSSSVASSSISPVQAKSIQKNLFRDKKKQIFSGSNKSKSGNWNTTKNDHHEYFENCHSTKLMFEKEKYNYLKEVDSKKLELEERRLEIEASTSMLKQEQLKLESKRIQLDNELSQSKKEQIVMQTNLEKSRLSLNNVEIYKARVEIKKSDPNVTDAYLDTIFPFM